MSKRPTLSEKNAPLTPFLPLLHSFSFNPQLSIPAHMTLSPKVHLSTAHLSSSLLCTPEQSCAPQSIPCIPQCVPLLCTPEHTRASQKILPCYTPNLPPVPGAFAGYWNVTLIPEGARHIRVAQSSHNYLALVERDGRYAINGDGVPSPPGTYEAAGTRVVYTRGVGPEETLQASGPTSQELLLQVLLREPNPGVHFEFWLPRERYGPFQAQAQALGWPLRQPQPREVEPQPAETPVVREAIPARDAPDPCGPCPDSRGRAHRLLHYCGSDFVFQARVLGRHRQAQETRYEVHILLIYKNRSPLRTREYVWAPGHCPCPSLAPHREYLLAARRVVSPDGTQDRLLLPHAGYARLWSPAEESRVSLAARRCPV